MVLSINSVNDSRRLYQRMDNHSSHLSEPGRFMQVLAKQTSEPMILHPT